MKAKVISGVFVALTAAMLTMNPAAAKVDETCVSDTKEAGFTTTQAKRICDRSNYYDEYAAKRGAMGWHCDGGGHKPYKAPGGAKQMRDAVCE